MAAQIIPKESPSIIQSIKNRISLYICKDNIDEVIDNELGVAQLQYIDPSSRSLCRTINLWWKVGDDWFYYHY